MLLLHSFVYLGVIASLLDWPCAEGIPYKQGDCPKVQPDISVNAICPEECLSDMDCPDDLKCCSDGCGYVCMKPEQDICNLPKDGGPCKGYFPRWFFNLASGHCEKFIYGGCSGNGNNFESKLECEKECKAGCPDGIPIVNCLRDPCEGAVCNAYPTAKCTANYCGGCNTDWTVKGDPVQCDRDLKGK